MSLLFASREQSTGASASVLPVTIQHWFPLGLTSLIFFQSKRLSRVFSSTTIWKHQFFSTLPSLWSNFHIYTWLLKKKIALTTQTFVGKVISLLFNMLPRFAIAFLPGSKHLLISWLRSLFAVILEPRKIKSVTFPLFPHLFAMKQWDQCHDLSFFSFFNVLNQFFHSPL